jgi:N-acylglucosamine 2-epimerase
MDLPQLHDFYRTCLLDDVIPFWLNHGIDSEGGINTCITDEGKVVSRNRWTRSQWRAVYVFSRLYNQVDTRPEWLAAAEGIAGFMIKAGPLPNGIWPLLYDHQRNVLRGYEEIFASGFAIYGLCELWKATRDPELLDLAVNTYRAVQTELDRDENPPTFPYTTPDGCMGHGISMMFSLTFHELAQCTGEFEIHEEADRHHRLVMECFLRDDRDLVLEWVRTDGSEAPPPAGTAVVPGHGIESMWFQMHIASAHAELNTLDRCVEAIQRHLEAGWDTEYGGLFLAVDADGRDEVAWDHADTKVFWPHTETLYATLLAYEHCREEWCLDWHERTRAYAWDHFPVKKVGEWHQELDRQGNWIENRSGLPVKDPFHLSRSLLLCLDVLERLV